MKTTTDIFAVLVGFVESRRTQAEAAKQLGVTPQYLSDIMHRKRNVTDAMADKLGYAREPTVWRKR